MSNLIERFESKFVPEPNSGCWLWTGASIPSGYGIIGKGGRAAGYFYAHRLSFEMHKGQIPNGMKVCHRCDIPACVNPDHLFLGSQKENMADKVAKGRHRPGELHPNAILSAQIVRQIRAEYATGKTSLSKLAAKYGICFQHVHDIVKNRIWKEVSHA